MTAKRTQIDSEHHQIALANRDKASSIQKNKNIKKELIEIQRFLEAKSVSGQEFANSTSV